MRGEGEGEGKREWVEKGEGISSVLRSRAKALSVFLALISSISRRPSHTRAHRGIFALCLCAHARKGDTSRLVHRVPLADTSTLLSGVNLSERRLRSMRGYFSMQLFSLTNFPPCIGGRERSHGRSAARVVSETCEFFV